MADHIFAGILDDLFEEAEGGHLGLFVSNPFSVPVLPLPAPTPPPRPETSTRQQNQNQNQNHHHRHHHHQHQLLPPLAPPNSARSYPRNLPPTSTLLSSLHAARPSSGIPQPPLPNPPSRPCDSRTPTPLTSRLPPPPARSLDAQRGNSRPSIPRSLPPLSAAQDWSRIGQGNNRLPTAAPSWDSSRTQDSDDPFLDALVSGAFSSPPRAQDRDHPFLNALVSGAFSSSPRARDGDHPFIDALVNGAFSSPSIPSERQHPNQPFGSASPPEPLPGSSRDPTTLAPSTPTDMPTTRESKRRTEGASRSAGSPVSKRRRSQEIPETPEQPDSRNTKRPRSATTKVEFDLDDNVFYDTEDKDIINLADPDESPKAESAPEVDNSVKLSAFQCVICMDDVTDLTVTYCGHLFCAECLHSSLHIDATKRICPICRQKIDVVPALGKFTTKSKGFWPLQLKLMTAKRSGKLPAR